MFSSCFHQGAVWGYKPSHRLFISPEALTFYQIPGIVR